MINLRPFFQYFPKRISGLCFGIIFFIWADITIIGSSEFIRNYRILTYKVPNQSTISTTEGIARLTPYEHSGSKVRHLPQLALSTPQNMRFYYCPFSDALEICISDYKSLEGKTIQIDWAYFQLPKRDDDYRMIFGVRINNQVVSDYTTAINNIHFYQKKALWILLCFVIGTLFVIILLIFFIRQDFRNLNEKPL